MQFQFNAADVAPSQGFEPLPPDWYDATITNVVQTPTKDNATTGNWYLKVEWSLLGDAGKNRKVWTNLNLQNTNPEAVRIAYEQLSAICHATGVLQMATTEQLHGIPHQIKLSLVPANDRFDAKNEVKGWRKTEQKAPGSMGGSFPAQGQAPRQFPAQGQQQMQPQQAQQPQAQQFPPQQAQFPAQVQQQAQQPQAQQQFQQAPAQAEQMQQEQPAQAAPSGKAPWEQ